MVATEGEDAAIIFVWGAVKLRVGGGFECVPKPAGAAMTSVNAVGVSQNLIPG